MIIKRISLVTAMVAVTSIAFGQYASDALRFSQTQQGSTSRIKAIGNTQTSIGGDMSSISGNPAGLGFFTKSEFAITPEFNNTSNNNNTFGLESNFSNSQVNLNQAGVVFYVPTYRSKGKDKTKGWLSFNFGLGFNRTNNFYFGNQYSDVNPDNSIADYYAELANSFTNNGIVLTPAQLEAEYNGVNGANAALPYFAYENFLISYGPQPGNNQVSDYFRDTDLNASQIQRDDRTGGQTEFNFAFGGNYSNQFYIGASVGITSLNYTTNRRFTEEGTSQGDNYTSNYIVNYRTTGTGVNGKLGFIYKPVDEIRFGASVTTPTYYAIDDQFSESINTTFTGSDRFESGPEQSDFSYRLRTPAKVNGGLSYFFGKVGFLTADVEYVNYEGMQFNNSTNDGGQFSDVIDANNDDLRLLYKNAVNYSAGGEINLQPVLIRVGYNHRSNSLNDTQLTNKQDTYSGGLGYRIGNIFLDLTYQRAQRSFSESPYFLNDGTEPFTNIKSTQNNVFLTLGARF